MLAEDAIRRSHGGQLRLPNEHQVATAAGGWDRALYLAGLARRQGPGGQRARAAPVAIIDVLDRCYEHYGVEPRFTDLTTFARANGIPFPRRERGKPWSTCVEEWKAARRTNGLPPREVGRMHANRRSLRVGCESET
jgi:hypothetical protein